MIRYLRSRRIRRRRVILRVDFNVPIAAGRVRDDFDLRRALPAIRRLLGRQNVLILLSHHSDERQSLRPVAAHLTRLLGCQVRFLKNPFRPAARALISSAGPGAVFLVENIRFWRGEKANSPAFSRSLARLGEVFVNDAFGESHRRYASISGLPRLLPSLAGPLLESEVKMLHRFAHRPRRPLVVLLGGVKISTKLPFLRRLAVKADRVMVGGAMANVLLASRDRSGVRPAGEISFKEIRRLAGSPKVLLPLDVVVARPEAMGRPRVSAVSAVRSGEAILDIGPRTRAFFRQALRGGRTIIWNGPLGLIERKAYARGTAAVARALVPLSSRVLIGGGDTVAFLAKLGLLKKFRYVSTGGGAMLAYLAGEKLPGLEALRRNWPNYSN